MLKQQQGQKTTGKLRDSLMSIRRSVAMLDERLRLRIDGEMDTFFRVLDTKLLVQLDPDYPLMVAITGSGSSGKSSLFNALLDKNISVVKAKAGLSRRVLAAVHPDVLARKGFTESLFEAFGAIPEPLGSQEELTEPGIPKYVASRDIPQHMILLDTPDFDIGDVETFSNRDNARPVLEASDVLIYIFVNANYNNRENTLFLRRVLTEIGRRKLLLVYRCSRTLPDREVLDHATVVARNIYDENFKQWLLGIYRADEDDSVAVGKTFMRVRPAGGSLDIHSVFRTLDRMQTRQKFMQSALQDIRYAANSMLQSAEREHLRLEIYRDAVRIATSWAVTDALKAYPQRTLLELFLKIWEKQQPGYIKAVKFVGRIMAWPAKSVVNVIRKSGSKSVENRSVKSVDPDAQYENNLVSAANTLRQQLLSREITVRTTRSDEFGDELIKKIKHLAGLARETDASLPYYETESRKRFTVFAPRPETSVSTHASGKKDSWKETLQEMTDTTLSATGVSKEFTEQLSSIARDFRSNMTVRQLFREAVTAGLTTVPAIGAVTYILMTGDFVVGAPNIFAGLSGLFGLHDLIAVVSIPATYPLNEIDRKNLENLLSRVYEAWFREKEKAIESSMLRHVSGRTIEMIEGILNQTGKPIEELSAALDDLKKELQE
jgi:hypothetical protein